jgi:hypothetical protein
MLGAAATWCLNGGVGVGAFTVLAVHRRRGVLRLGAGVVGVFDERLAAAVETDGKMGDGGVGNSGGRPGPIRQSRLVLAARRGLAASSVRRMALPWSFTSMSPARLDDAWRTLRIPASSGLCLAPPGAAPCVLGLLGAGRPQSHTATKVKLTLPTSSPGLVFAHEERAWTLHNWIALRSPQMLRLRSLRNRVRL